MATDPVCGMFVEPSAEALQLVRDNRTYYFCAESCLLAFSEPEQARRSLARRLAVAWPLAVLAAVLTYVPRIPGAAGVAAVAAAVVQFYPGSVFYRGAFDAVRGRVANMDVLIAVGTSAAFGYSVAVLALPGRLPPSLFFDASSLIVTLILTGNYLEQYTRDRAGSALRRLEEMLPRSASVLRDGRESSSPVNALVPGDRVVVRPGERFPADGTIRDGMTSVDLSLLTGESMPVARAPGDPVLAGAVNGDGRVEVETTRAAPDSFVAQIGRMLTTAEMSRVPLQRTANRIAAVFVPFVLAVAVAAAVAWHTWGGASFTTSLLVFVTVAITACPCAFGLATPAAILVGTGRAGESGILFRGEDAIERSARADLVVTDKTGTLTSDSPVVVALRAIPPATEPPVASLALGLALGSEHPFARALVRWAADPPVTPLPVSGIRSVPGRGVVGRLGSSEVALLSGAAARTAGVDLGPAEGEIRAAEENGDSWSALTRDGRLVGIVRFRAPLVPGAAAAVAALRSMGVEVVMATGDHPAAAHRVAREVGIARVVADCSPAQKVELVEQYRRDGRRVAFVGDGVNDAAALAAADVGVAIGTGTDVAREAGQVLLVRTAFGGVPAALGIARRIVGRVRRNLAWAIGYNAVLLPIAAGALVPWFGLSLYTVLPIAGAAAMGLSSTTVVLNSLSLRWAKMPGLPRARGGRRDRRAAAAGA
ncbi:MAG TPA: heavy metal translocating P-type ATPase [Thermoplasmata archaeon]|nr:heavy metal translocating P-type ATPase [Thermoplasmata archaeon]